MDQLPWAAGCQVRRAVSARLGSPELEFLNGFWICGCAAPALAKGSLRNLDLRHQFLKPSVSYFGLGCNTVLVLFQTLAQIPGVWLLAFPTGAAVAVLLSQQISKQCFLLHFAPCNGIQIDNESLIMYAALARLEVALSG